ncbi:MAG: sulfotransferase domain-containing protein [Planctomycetota bacterium]
MIGRVQIDQLKARATVAALPLRDAKLSLRAMAIRACCPRSARSSAENVFHCCVQRTGSRWLLRVLSDPIIYRYSGLTQQPYPQLPSRLRRDAAGKPLPPKLRPHTIIGPLYYDFGTFTQLTRPENYRAFFVLRDPRDMVVSNYFSTRDTHRLNPLIAERRHALKQISEEEGLLQIIQWQGEDNLFGSIESWFRGQEEHGEQVRVFRYEDITGERQSEVLRELLAFIGVDLPEEDFARLREKYSLQAMRGGKTGEVVANSHYRSGKPGGWRKHFTDAVAERLAAAAGSGARALYEF